MLKFQDHHYLVLLLKGAYSVKNHDFESNQAIVQNNSLFCLQSDYYCTKKRRRNKTQRLLLDV